MAFIPVFYSKEMIVINFANDEFIRFVLTMASLVMDTLNL